MTYTCPICKEIHAIRPAIKGSMQLVTCPTTGRLIQVTIK